MWHAALLVEWWMGWRPWDRIFQPLNTALCLAKTASDSLERDLPCGSFWKNSARGGPRGWPFFPEAELFPAQGLTSSPYWSPSLHAHCWFPAWLSEVLSDKMSSTQFLCVVGLSQWCFVQTQHHLFMSRQSVFISKADSWLAGIFD